MDLKIKDVAKLLGVSEATIRRWVTDGKIPAYRLHHETRFSLAEIEDWMMSRRINVIEEKKEEEKEGLAQGGMQQFSLFRAIHRGGCITLNVKDKEEAIRETSLLVAKKLNLDAEVLQDLLLDRERMMSTALGNGIAVPHPRDCVLSRPTDMVLVVYLNTPIEFGALDGMPVHTLFFLFSSSDKTHLNLLSKIAHLAGNEKMVDLLKAKSSSKDLLDHIKEWETSLSLSAV